jgi:hypothetical protein
MGARWCSGSRNGAQVRALGSRDVRSEQVRFFREVEEPVVVAGGGALPASECGVARETSAMRAPVVSVAAWGVGLGQQRKVDGGPSRVSAQRQTSLFFFLFSFSFLYYQITV